MSPRTVGPQAEESRVKRWGERFTQADKLYEKWESRFHPQRLENYYEGFQWSGVPEEDAQKKYAINLTYGSIETARPTLLFARPKFVVTPKPGRGNDFGSESEAQAQLCQDTLQTFVDDTDVAFDKETHLAVQEAFFRFGVVEVGYSANWIDNPNADKPVLKESTNDPLLGGDGQPVMQPDKVLEDGTRELLYVRRIPARQFRVSIGKKNHTGALDWVGYWEWAYLEDVKRNGAYANTKTLKASGAVDPKLRSKAEDEPDQSDMVKLWKVWDLRTKTKHVIAEGHKRFLVEDEPWDVLPLAVLKFHERLDEFYPLPPVFNWLSPQDELNETREMQRVHRRRFTRRYVYREGEIETSELEKLESGGDGVYAKHNGAPGSMPLVPVPDAPLDASIWRNEDVTKNDFMQVSGVSGDARGNPESTTATQASIVESRSRLRESSQRMLVASWLSEIARIMLVLLRTKMALPFWVQRNVDQTGPAAMEEAATVAAMWQKITAKSLGEMDMDISVDVSSLSPVTEDMQRQNWNQVLSLMSNPGLMMLFAQSDLILRKTMALYGVRNETEVRELQQVAAQVAQMMAMAQAGQAGTPAAPAVPSTGGGGGMLGGMAPLPGLPQ